MISYTLIQQGKANNLISEHILQVMINLFSRAELIGEIETDFYLGV